MTGGLAVVLSGGGAKGAFQVGVLDELIGTRGVRFDAFCGVSTGSIQALGGAMDDMPGLVRQWTSINGNRDVYKKRPLGAAGAAEAIIAIKAINDGIVPPTINTTNLDPSIPEGLKIALQPIKKTINIAMSNTFGFGGHNAIALFKKWDK